MPYSPATDADIRHMLRRIGVSRIDDLFADIPAELRSSEVPNIPLGIGEPQLMREATRLAARNRDVDTQLTFLGYGAWDHFVPQAVRTIVSRSEFATAYTPYQPEVSQGTLQAIFEYQTAICELTGLDVSNASVYDGSTALADAMAMCAGPSIRKRHARVLVLRTVNGFARSALATYARSWDIELHEVPFDVSAGTTTLDTVSTHLAAGPWDALIVQTPNAFGALEDAPAICSAAAEHNVPVIVSSDPISLGLLAAPGSYGADIVVGEGQVLGNDLSYGGPGFGFLAAHEKYMRRMPGRIVGESIDVDGTRAYTLTLQTREQHIRREKATSNICTNQSLNAVAAISWLSYMGPIGLERLATLCFDATLRLAAALRDAGAASTPIFAGPSFRELVVRTSRPAQEVIDDARAMGVHPGFDLGEHYPELGDDVMVISVTEQHSDDDLAQLAQVLVEVGA